ncbi:sucrose-6-phosphate hydrolase [Limimaricola cinnabarinus]|uniref:Sucrose-6-phosphate hydrolase n=1 Tax=Limimaricola cinnabarinus LL-001 TaxID=1337093 RepID=U2YQG1_9RHOB|nr:sucrose-6-phosphate hydrolase [Limimaricola cinnabarinus]GAD57676.1 sucrose-6-phosphate hydrolase [Limimaricola cinnabarinus LL-001]
MPLSLDDKWIWDSWYAHDGERWHGYFLQADKSLGDPDLRHFNVSQGHAVSDDLINWEHKGTCLKPAPTPAWDDTTTWTGSVVQGADGVWHLFYTGGGSAEKGLYQRIGHATSTDMHSWERVGSGLCLDLEGPNAIHYEAEMQVGFWPDRAMRDPYVMKDPDGGGWLMYFTACAPGIAEVNAGGAIGFATSPDLHEWTLQPPVFVGDYGQLEVPQVFEVDGRWYCLFCTADIHWSEERKTKAGVPPVTGNHYLIAESPRGPWTVAPGFLDGDLPCRRYAARVLETENGRVIMGFADGGKDAFGGYVMDPMPLKVAGDGRLFIEHAG